ELVALAGLPPDRLPPIRTSQEVVGKVTAAAAAATGLAEGTPVVAGCADLVASALLAGAVAGGDMGLEFGGSRGILLPRRKPRPPLPASISIIISRPACGSATAAWPRAAVCSTGSCESGRPARRGPLPPPGCRCMPGSIGSPPPRRPGPTGWGCWPLCWGGKTPPPDPHPPGPRCGPARAPRPPPARGSAL